MEKCTCDIVKPAEKAIAAFTTSELLDELRLREGVHASFAAEGALISINVSGPAMVIVFDGCESPHNPLIGWQAKGEITDERTVAGK